MHIHIINFNSEFSPHFKNTLGKVIRFLEKLELTKVIFKSFCRITLSGISISIPSEKNAVFNAVNGLESGLAKVANSSGKLIESILEIIISLLEMKFWFEILPSIKIILCQSVEIGINLLISLISEFD